MVVACLVARVGSSVRVPRKPTESRMQTRGKDPASQRVPDGGSGVQESEDRLGH